MIFGLSLPKTKGLMEIVKEEQQNKAMEASNHQEIQNGANSSIIVKGKRTKRHRPLIDTNIGEEEDMANCLILLAQGQSLDSSSSPNNETLRITNNHKDVKFTSKKLLETPNGSKSGRNVYECKTCFKTFPSFQALGGHRASHMRSKKNIETIKISLVEEDNNNNNKLNSSYSLALSIGQDKTSLYNKNESPLESNGQGKKQRLHKCSTCGAEFSSGQALGGHMRRHRGTNGGPSSGGLYSHYNLPKSTTSPTPSFTRLTGSLAMDNEGLTTTMEGSKLSLDLDLNLPTRLEVERVPRIPLEQEERGLQTSSIPKPPLNQHQEKLVLTPTSLVGCQY